MIYLTLRVRIILDKLLIIRVRVEREEINRMFRNPNGFSDVIVSKEPNKIEWSCKCNFR